MGPGVEGRGLGGDEMRKMEGAGGRRGSMKEREKSGWEESV